MIPRSWLYCPGNVPGRLVNAHAYGADGIILDLEDSVAPTHKEEARYLVEEALKGFVPLASAAPDSPVYGVRVNSVDTRWWRDDVETVVRAGADIIRLPKVESPDAVERLNAVVSDAERRADRVVGSVRVQCILETPIGIEAAFAIAASFRVESISFGAEDYCAATGIDRNGPAWALDYPRSRIVSAAASRGLAAYDTVWGAFRDIDGLRADAARSRDLGFAGKSAIHPDQIEEINRLFSPTAEQIAWARRVVERAESNADIGATAVDGSMIDAPVVERARRILSRERR